MTGCTHEEFKAEVTVARLTDTGRFLAEVRIQCARCQRPFRFMGIQAGVSFDRPACSIDDLEARLPIEPQELTVRRIQTRATFQMPTLEEKPKES